MPHMHETTVHVMRCATCEGDCPKPCDACYNVAANVAINGGGPPPDPIQFAADMMVIGYIAGGARAGSGEQGPLLEHCCARHAKLYNDVATSVNEATRGAPPGQVRVTATGITPVDGEKWPTTKRPVH